MGNREPQEGDSLLGKVHLPELTGQLEVDQAHIPKHFFCGICWRSRVGIPANFEAISFSHSSLTYRFVTSDNNYHTSRIIDMEVSKGCDPVYRSMSREFTHPEDIIQHHTMMSTFSQSKSVLINQSTEDRILAIPPQCLYQLSSTTIRIPCDHHSTTEIIPILQQFFLNYPAEFSFQNWIVSLISSFLMAHFLPTVESLHLL